MKQVLLKFYKYYQYILIDILPKRPIFAACWLALISLGCVFILPLIFFALFLRALLVMLTRYSTYLLVFSLVLKIKNFLIYILNWIYENVYTFSDIEALLIVRLQNRTSYKVLFLLLLVFFNTKIILFLIPQIPILVYYYYNILFFYYYLYVLANKEWRAELSVMMGYFIPFFFSPVIRYI